VSETRDSETRDVVTMYSPAGELTKNQAFMLAEARDFMDAYAHTFKRSLSEDADDEQSLPLRYRELLIAAVLITARAPQEGIVAHLGRAFSLGLTQREALDAIMALHVPGGAPALWNGVRALRTTLAPAESGLEP